MKTPSKKEIIERYKNAKEVKCDFGVYKGIYELKGNEIIYNKQQQSYFTDTTNFASDVMLFNPKYGYAEIISYKEKNYQLSETFVKELIKEPNIKEAFIREGIIENDKFEVGKWYKYTDRDGFLVYCEEVISESQIKGYGKSFAWSNSRFWVTNNLTLATTQEVETAFKNLMLEKGFVSGIKVKSLWKNSIGTLDLGFKTDFKIEENEFWMGGYCLFKDGKFAEIIDETIEIKKSLILNTPNDLELGKLIRKMV